MVDPMLLIVQNSRWFLSAVTPTAVAPTADQFGPYYTSLDHIELVWTPLNQFGPY